MTGRRLMLVLALSAALAAPAAPAAASDHLMRVKEIAVSQGGDSTRQFVELQDSSNEPFPSPPYKLISYDAAGNEVGDQTVSTLVGPPDETSPILLASVNWQVENPSPAVNQSLTITLPQGAGQVCFTRGAEETPIDCMTYGCITSELSSESGGANGAVPPDGQSAQRDQFDVVTLGTPTPKAANTSGTPTVACPTPPEAPTIVTGPGNGEEIHNSQTHFYWVGAEAGGTFECSENGDPYFPCDPPHTMGPESNGDKTFAVRQVGEQQTLGTPVTVNYSVLVQGPPADITILDDAYLPDGISAESGATRKPLGEPFIWKWGSDGSGTTDFHNVRQNKGLFNSGDDVTSSPPFSTTPSAGSFPFYCTVHSSTGMRGTVEVLPIRDSTAEPAGLPFKVAWDDPATSTTANKFDVRYRVNGGKLKTWFDDTKKTGAIFGKNNRPVKVKEPSLYEFQVRSQKGRRAKSGFSPPLPVRP
jgi:hypothetical protein